MDPETRSDFVSGILLIAAIAFSVEALRGVPLTTMILTSPVVLFGGLSAGVMNYRRRIRETSEDTDSRP